MSAQPHLRPVPDLETGEIVQNESDLVMELRHQLLVAEQDNRRLEKDLRAWRSKYERSLEDKDARMRRDKYFPAAVALIQEWKRECGHPNSSEDDPKRLRLALSVVKRYSKQPEKLSMVIQQAKHLAFVDPESGFKYDEFGRIFGSSDEIEARATKWYLWNKRQAANLGHVVERARAAEGEAA